MTCNLSNRARELGSSQPAHLPTSSWEPYLAVIIVSICCAALAFGCAGEQKKPALSVLECRISLLEPYLGDMTHDLVRAALAGNGTPLLQALANLGLGPKEVAEIGRAWHACKPALPPAPKPDAGLMRASL